MISQEYLKTLIEYNPITGEFVHKKLNRYIGTDNGNGYIRISLENRRYYAHQLAWLYVHGEWPECIDHIDGRRRNNKINNLRLADATLNSQNRKEPRAYNTTGLLGVSRNRGNFRANIIVKGKIINLGTYKTAEEAHQKYIEAKREYHEFNTL